MGQTPVYALPWPELTGEPADAPHGFQQLANRVEAVFKPGASSGQVPIWDNATKTWVAGAVGATSISDAAVATTKLADASVTTPKVADGAVTNPKLAANSVDASKIVDGTVGNAELANGAVGTSKVADAALTVAKLASGVLPTAGLYLDGAMGWGGDANFRQVGAMNVLLNTNSTYLSPDAGNGFIWFNQPGVYAVIAHMQLNLAVPHGPGYVCSTSILLSNGAQFTGPASSESINSPGGQNYNNGTSSIAFAIYQPGVGTWAGIGGWSNWTGSMSWRLYAVRLGS